MTRRSPEHPAPVKEETTVTPEDIISIILLALAILFVACLPAAIIDYISAYRIWQATDRLEIGMGFRTALGVAVLFFCILDGYRWWEARNGKGDSNP